MQRLSQLAAWLGQELNGADAPLTGACIDTRKLQPGELFIALPGERVDGHDFLRKAAALGAAGALVARRVDLEFPQLVVPDVLAAMQQLAARWRVEWGGRVVGVTGSNGKTSVKTLLAQLLSRRHTVYATPGNLNNHIGLPLCLLNLRPEHAIAVLEMGASHAGEIAAMADWARPDVGIVTQAGDAHLEGFGSRDGVARAKGEMFAALGEQGIAVINLDDPYRALWQSLAAPARVLGFGRGADADVRASDEDNRPLEQRFTLHLAGAAHRLSLPLPGRHSVMNALAAAAAAQALGLPEDDIRAGLEQAGGVSGRLQLRPLPGGGQLIDDSYNANPGSVRAAIEVLAACAPPRHFVLGDMAELGGSAEAAHRQAGTDMAAAGIERLWTCGPLSALAAEAFGPAARHFQEREALCVSLRDALEPGCTVLVKGSRSAGMDRVVEALVEAAA